MPRPRHLAPAAFAFALALAAAVLAAPRPADACSVARTFMAPTNVELVAITPRIVIARAVAEIPGGRDTRIALEVVRVLRGSGVAVGDRIEVRGSAQRYLGAAPPNDFSRARRGAYIGSCTAYDYEIGKHFLLFLDQYGSGSWDTRGTPFARINEEVDPAGDAWVTAVAEYVRIADLPAPVDRRKALDALVARGAKKGATAADRAIADDVARHLATPSPHKSFAELEALYKAGTGDRDRVVIAIGIGGDPAARTFMRDLVVKLRAGMSRVDAANAITAVAPYYEKVADPAALAELGEVYIALGARAKQERWPLMWLLIRRADASQAALMDRVLASADEEEAGRLAAWFGAHPTPAARRDLERRVAGRYAERYEMALGLAAMGDPAIFAWAKRQLPGKDDRRWVALYAIAHSPLPEADALAGKLITRGGADLALLIQGYREAHHPAVDRRLAEIARRTDLSTDAKESLDRVLDERKPSP